MRKKFAIVMIALVGLSSFAVSGSSPAFVRSLLESVQDNPVTKLFSPARKVEIKKTPQVQTNIKKQEAPNEIPAQVPYLFLFREVAAFEEKAVEAESKGEDGSSYRTVYKRLASLTDEQSEFLRKTATGCAAEVKITDKAAGKIGDRLRAQYQTQLASGNMNPPPPSVELTELQKQRDEIILKHRDLLKENFGEAFPRFESYVE